MLSLCYKFKSDNRHIFIPPPHRVSFSPGTLIHSSIHPALRSILPVPRGQSHTLQVSTPRPHQQGNFQGRYRNGPSSPIQVTRCLETYQPQRELIFPAPIGLISPTPWQTEGRVGRQNALTRVGKWGQADRAVVHCPGQRPLQASRRLGEGNSAESDLQIQPVSGRHP